MSLPPTQPIETRPQRVVRMLPNVGDRKNIVTPLLEFLQRELSHWQGDLEERQKEGEYYLDWLAMIDPGESEKSSFPIFSDLVREEIPALTKRVKAQSVYLEDSEIDQLFSIQQVYVQLCKRYDRIKLGIMEKMEWGNNLEIY